MSLFSTLQRHAGTLATIAAGTVIARIVNKMQSDVQEHEPGPPMPQPGYYKPTPVDVIVVKIMIEKTSKLPPEVMDIIVDEAEYWVHSETSVNCTSENIRVVGTTPAENKLILRCPPIGLQNFKTVGSGFKTASLPLKSGDELPLTEPLSSLALLEPRSSSTEMTHEVPREYFYGSIKQPPLLTHPVRKIVFKIRSKDQGWGGGMRERGSYRGAWTWFEAGLEKFDKHLKCDGSCKMAPAPAQNSGSDVSESENMTSSNESNLCICSLQSIHPPIERTPEGHLAYHHELSPVEDFRIQANKTAHKEFINYEVVWSWTDDIHPDSPEAEQLDEMGRGKGSGTGNFVRSLKLGEVVTVWGKARFGGWVNHIESVKVEIYWTV